jgi:hypothetical protein
MDTVNDGADDRARCLRDRRARRAATMRCPTPRTRSLRPTPRSSAPSRGSSASMPRRSRRRACSSSAARPAATSSRSPPGIRTLRFESDLTGDAGMSATDAQRAWRALRRSYRVQRRAAAVARAFGLGARLGRQSGACRGVPGVARRELRGQRAPAPANSALTSVSGELKIKPNWSLRAKSDGQLAPGSQTYSGTGTVRYSW